MAKNKKQTVKPKRIFSRNDEIILLNGLLQIKSKRGIDPAKILSKVYSTHKYSFSNKTIRKRQLSDKIHKLKKKYQENLTMKEQGSLVFIDTHKEKLFELSNELWGVENGAVDREIGADEGEHGDDNMHMNLLKRAEMDRRCLELKVQEDKLRLQRSLLLKEHVDLIYKSLLESSEVDKESREA
ncbi:unnamed protein product [Trifolium pratense]|uniref:Uncharacterized protein n=1 Tax=Trifolium pratense TaxID=57577 RepID=A0ACB0JNW0_TRIPR|nr:unnamed protein product [Trifolium pratense]